jgi:PST family polysaccharide transporter
MAFRLPAFSPVSWVTAEKITQQALWLVLFTVLAPILGPEPYGAFSIVMVFVGFCEFVLGEVAIEALVTVDELDPLHMATANVATGALALAVSLMLVFLAPVIGAAFHDDELMRLTWSLIPLPALSLLSAVPLAVLRRSLQYKQLAIRSIVGLTIGGLFGIALALAGAGVWALALQVLAQRVAEVAIAWWSVPHRFQLGWSARHFREMRSVAMNMLTARAMIFAGGQLPRLILGYSLGPSELGLFVLATRFLDIIVNTMLFPRVSVGRIELRKLQPGSPELQQRFARIMQDGALLSFPALLGTVVIMPDLIGVWLDPRWLPGTVAAQFVVLGGLPLVVFYCLDAALLAAKLSSVFRTMATVQAVTVLVTVLCVAPFGLDATCLALAVRPWLLLPPFLWVFRQRCHLAAIQVLRPALPSLLGAVIMTAILSLPFLHPEGLDVRVNFIMLIAAGAIVYGTFLYSFCRAQFTSTLAGLFAHRS